MKFRIALSLVASLLPLALSAQTLEFDLGLRYGAFRSDFQNRMAEDDAFSMGLSGGASVNQLTIAQNNNGGFYTFPVVARYLHNVSFGSIYASVGQFGYSKVTAQPDSQAFATTGGIPYYQREFIADQKFQQKDKEVGVHLTSLARDLDLSLHAGRRSLQYSFNGFAPYYMSAPPVFLSGGGNRTLSHDVSAPTFGAGVSLALDANTRVFADVTTMNQASQSMTYTVLDLALIRSGSSSTFVTTVQLNQTNYTIKGRSYLLGLEFGKKNDTRFRFSYQRDEYDTAYPSHLTLYTYVNSSAGTASAVLPTGDLVSDLMTYGKTSKFMVGTALISVIIPINFGK